MPILPGLASPLPARSLLGVTCALGAVALIAKLALAAPVAVAAAPPALAPLVAPVAPSIAPAAPAPLAPAAIEPSPDADAGQLLLVFAAGGASYLKLADLKTPDGDGELAVPPHGELRLRHDDMFEAAIATVAARHVPAAYARWSGRAVKVENGCVAHVVGFAVVARLVGPPSYAGLDAWTAAGVMEAGHPVLAARLDRCTGRFARDAALPEVVIPSVRHDEALEAAARAALLGSPLAAATQREWDDQLPATSGGPRAWHTDATFTSQVVRHPGTGATFVSVHGYVAHGCGEPMANLWALFRVDAGRLVPVQLRALGELEQLDALLDVDGDGELELLGKPWLGTDVVVTHASGAPLTQLAAPFIGCPC